MTNDSQIEGVSADANLPRSESLRVLERAVALVDSDERMDDLLADLRDGFANGWEMAVGTCLRDALDIKHTDKVAGGRKGRGWTQGGSFAFSQGDTLYDTPLAYERWDIALQSIGKGYQVLGGAPSRPETQRTLYRRNASFTGSLKGDQPRANVPRRKEVFEATPTDWTDKAGVDVSVERATGKGPSTELLQYLCELGALDSRVETVRGRLPGSVRIQIMVANADRSLLRVVEEKCMSQDDFVALLISGSPLQG